VPKAPFTPSASARIDARQVHRASRRVASTRRDALGVNGALGWLQKLTHVPLAIAILLVLSAIDFSICTYDFVISLTRLSPSTIRPLHRLPIFLTYFQSVGIQHLHRPKWGNCVARGHRHGRPNAGIGFFYRHGFLALLIFQQHISFTKF